VGASKEILRDSVEFKKMNQPMRQPILMIEKLYQLGSSDKKYRYRENFVEQVVASELGL
jgi:hypothetical protein